MCTWNVSPGTYHRERSLTEKQSTNINPGGFIFTQQQQNVHLFICCFLPLCNYIDCLYYIVIPFQRIPPINTPGNSRLPPLAASLAAAARASPNAGLTGEQFVWDINGPAGVVAVVIGIVVRVAVAVIVGV